MTFILSTFAIERTMSPGSPRLPVPILRTIFPGTIPVFVRVTVFVFNFDVSFFRPEGFALRDRSRASICEIEITNSINIRRGAYSFDLDDSPKSAISRTSSDTSSEPPFLKFSLIEDSILYQFTVFLPSVTVWT